MDSSPPKWACLSVNAVAELAAHRGHQTIWAGSERDWSWTEFAGAISQCQSAARKAGVQPGEVVLAPGESSLTTLAWLVGLASMNAIVAPLRRARWCEAEAWPAEARATWQVSEAFVERRPDHQAEVVAPAAPIAQLRSRNHPGLILATGGTTGSPKLVLHDLERLLGTIPVQDGACQRILPLMRFDHIGGLDVAWRALGAGQILVEPPLDLSPESVSRVATTQRVQVLPATPTFLRPMPVS